MQTQWNQWICLLFTDKYLEPKPASGTMLVFNKHALNKRIILIFKCFEHMQTKCIIIELTFLRKSFFLFLIFSKLHSHKLWVLIDVPLSFLSTGYVIYEMSAWRQVSSKISWSLMSLEGSFLDHKVYAYMRQRISLC